MTTVNSEVRLVPDILSLSLASSLDDSQRAALLAKRLEALSSPVRLRALRILAEAPENTIGVRRLAVLLGAASQGGVSTHIQRLVLAGFLECMESRGKGIDVRHYYRVKREAIQQAFSDLLEYTRIVEVIAAPG